MLIVDESGVLQPVAAASGQLAKAWPCRRCRPMARRASRSVAPCAGRGDLSWRRCTVDAGSGPDGSALDAHRAAALRVARQRPDLPHRAWRRPLRRRRPAPDPDPFRPGGSGNRERATARRAATSSSMSWPACSRSARRPARAGRADARRPARRSRPPADEAPTRAMVARWDDGSTVDARHLLATALSGDARDDRRGRLRRAPPGAARRPAGRHPGRPRRGRARGRASCARSARRRSSSCR